MKKILLALGLVMNGMLSYGQSCCEEATATCHETKDQAKGLAPDPMQLMASTKEFQAMHVEPLPFTFVSKAGGEMIKMDAPDGKAANGFFIKAKSPSNKYLLVYQEWWGLNDYVKQEAEKYYNELDGKVNVLALDMYDGNVATTREDAGKYMSQAKPERLESIMKAGINYGGPKAEFASIGWCFGGMLSLKSALLEGSQAVGCVMYYGRPEQDIDKLKALKTDVIGFFGTKDKGIPPTVVEQFQKNMKMAGKKIEVKMYDADHAFANPSNPIYDEAATKDAFQHSSEYLKKKLL
ncbi:dienelactone hydrolase [Siphonobacter sp. BAB-5385]|uniref:dienelactone hydrolase family protein n=1 Tax=Siphonobacter sp. BAB-5385 TaxID=1864822 RepID=UPI000B9E2CB1|nr:dienelactone hydrolase family protein [Siphonobacter sp. BAB-5385]OZI08368.1 dienelactone hydrolase [Siphonobacter sp. BAB-5385]